MIRDNQKFNESVKTNSSFLNELSQKLPEFFIDNEFDIEKFTFALKEQNIEELSNGYRLDFIGKNYAKKQAGEQPNTVIVPDKDHNEKKKIEIVEICFLRGII